MKNIAPLLLVGGAALLAMGGKKKKAAEKKLPSRFKFYVGGKNLFSRGALHGAIKNQRLDSTLVDQGDLAAWFYEPAWDGADGIIVAVDTANDELAGAWVAPMEAAGEKAKGMSLTELGGPQGVEEAIGMGLSGIA